MTVTEAWMLHFLGSPQQKNKIVNGVLNMLGLPKVRRNTKPLCGCLVSVCCFVIFIFLALIPFCN